MRKPLNSVTLAGYLYQHNLELKTVQNEQSENKGMEFISGTIDVATDDECTNIVSVHFTYVPKLKKDGTPDKRFGTLNKIMNECKAYITDKEDATKIRVATNLGLNDFYVDDEESENGVRLVSAKRCEGGFITFVSDLSSEERNKFMMDMVITGVQRVEANEEKNIEEHVRLRGCVFDFRKAVLPVDFVVKNEGGMDYFENLGVDNSNPIYTKVWGKLNYSAIRTERTEESAFGEAEVTYYDRKVREWIVTGTQKMVYEFEDGSEILTPEEVKKAIQDREVYLAEIKSRKDEWEAQKKKSSASAFNEAPAAAPTVTKGGFSF